MGSAGDARLFWMDLYGMRWRLDGDLTTRIPCSSSMGGERGNMDLDGRPRRARVSQKPHEDSHIQGPACLSTRHFRVRGRKRKERDSENSSLPNGGI